MWTAIFSAISNFLGLTKSRSDANNTAAMKARDRAQKLEAIKNAASQDVAQGNVGDIEEGISK